jgi:anti-anti-sigma factor
MTETSSYTVCPGASPVWEWNKEPALKLSFEIRINENAAVVTCKGRIVYRNEVAALSSTVADLLPRARQLVLELSQVETVDGAGLGELLALQALAQAHGCTMRLAAPSKSVRELFAVTGLASALEIHETVNDALQAAQPQAV